MRKIFIVDNLFDTHRALKLCKNSDIFYPASSIALAVLLNDGIKSENILISQESNHLSFADCIDSFHCFKGPLSFISPYELETLLVTHFTVQDIFDFLNDSKTNEIYVFRKFLFLSFFPRPEKFGIDFYSAFWIHGQIPVKSFYSIRNEIHTLWMYVRLVAKGVLKLMHSIASGFFTHDKGKSTYTFIDKSVPASLNPIKTEFRKFSITNFLIIYSIKKFSPLLFLFIIAKFFPRIYLKSRSKDPLYQVNIRARMGERVYNKIIEAATHFTETTNCHQIILRNLSSTSAYLFSRALSDLNISVCTIQHSLMGHDHWTAAQLHDNPFITQRFVATKYVSEFLGRIEHIYPSREINTLASIPKFSKGSLKYKSPNWDRKHISYVLTGFTTYSLIFRGRRLPSHIYLLNVIKNIKALIDRYSIEVILHPFDTHGNPGHARQYVALFKSLGVSVSSLPTKLILDNCFLQERLVLIDSPSTILDDLIKSQPIFSILDTYKSMSSDVLSRFDEKVVFQSSLNLRQYLDSQSLPLIRSHNKEFFDWSTNNLYA